MIDSGTLHCQTEDWMLELPKELMSDGIRLNL